MSSKIDPNEYQLCDVTLPIDYKNGEWRYDVFKGYCRSEVVSRNNKQYWCNVYNDRGVFFYSSGVNMTSVKC